MAKDLDLIPKIEQLTHRKLKRVDKLKAFWSQNEVVVDDAGKIIALGLASPEAILVDGMGWPKIQDASFLRDLKNLTQLDLSDNQIQDASFLRDLKNLTQLNLSHNQIQDASFLRDLKNLTQLNLSHNQIQDASFLRDLKNLTQLNLSDNQIQDASFLRDLKNLTQLNLWNNKIQDASFLRDLKNLTQLNLWNNKIQDYSFLRDLKNLTQLDLSDNKIQDYSFLRDLKNLTQLDLSDNQIQDYSFLRDLKNLTQLNLSHNQIQDASFLRDLKNLTQLNLSHNQIQDASFLRDLKNLTQLNLSYNQIQDASFLRDLKNLTQLNLSDNQIQDASFLRDLKNLTQLNLWNNKIQDYSFLRDLKNLTQLNLSHNQIQDYSFLRDLKNLTQLDLSHNQIQDASFLRDLKNLTQLNLWNNQIQDASFLRDLKNLTQLDLSHNQIQDASFLRDLKNLTQLDLSHNQIQDASFLRDLKNLTQLNLSYNQIQDASFLRDLKNLTQLDLSYNKIQDASFLRDLKNLTQLNLSDNKIQDVSFLRDLKNLTQLNLSHNQIQDASFLRDLKNLTQLNLRTNQIQDASFLRDLKNLTQLNLSHNQIQDASFLRDLKNLTQLNLWNNKIQDASFLRDLNYLTNLDIQKNQIKSLPREIFDRDVRLEVESHYGATNTYVLTDNPIESPPLETLKQGREAVLNYFATLRTTETVEVFEAKLLIVGEGKVGKTWLMNKLIYGEVDPETVSTEGIDIHAWRVATDAAPNFRINFWDFGGQEIYHATHQFFLTKRSLYLFVWEARTDDDVRVFDYWLNAVSLLSDDAPLLMVLNKADERMKAIDEVSFQKKFPNIIGFHKVSAKEGTGIDDLTAAIKKEICTLPHIGDPLPKVWLDIRKKLEDLDTPSIPYSEYKKICKEFGQNEKQAAHLSDYFHDLGIFLHFSDNPILRDIVFLQPDWATNAVYKVTDTRAIQENSGKFDYDELRTIWQDYPEDKYAPLLELMKKFELCFQLQDTQTYIVPELLPAKRPPFQWDESDNLRFEYHYDFMPAGIVTRFIVRTHDMNKEEIYWKEGVVLQRGGTEALIIGEPLNRKIRIRVRGDERKELLYAIRREIDHIHKTLNDPDLQEMIPCNCSVCRESDEPQFYDYYILRKRIVKGVGNIYCDKGECEVTISTLIDQIIAPLDIGLMTDEPISMRALEEMMRKRGDIHLHFSDIGNPTTNVKTEVTQSQKINIDLKVELPTLQSDFRKLKRELAGLDKDLKAEIEDVEDDLLSITPKSDEGKINKALNKVGGFLQDLGDENSKFNKILKGTKKGVDLAKKLAQTYGKFTGWALPHVPDIFL